MHAHYHVSNGSAVQYIVELLICSIYTTLMWLYVLESIAYTVQHVAYIDNAACAVYAWPICALSSTVESHIVVQSVTRAQCLVGVV